MDEIERIRDQLLRAFEGEAWHGPSLLEALSGVGAEQAAHKPVPGAHSIWEIVLHVTATHRLVERRLAGEALRLSPEEDWPKVGERGEAAWEAALEALRQGYRELLAACDGIAEEALDRPVVPGFSSLYVTLHGLIQHDLYHAGQIVLLKKSPQRGR